jgi:hypothetical protein
MEWKSGIYVLPDVAKCKKRAKRQIVRDCLGKGPGLKRKVVRRATSMLPKLKPATRVYPKTVPMTKLIRMHTGLQIRGQLRGQKLSAALRRQVFDDCAILIPNIIVNETKHHACLLDANKTPPCGLIKRLMHVCYRSPCCAEQAYGNLRGSDRVNNTPVPVQCQEGRMTTFPTSNPHRRTNPNVRSEQP